MQTVTELEAAIQNSMPPAVVQRFYDISVRLYRAGVWDLPPGADHDFMEQQISNLLYFAGQECLIKKAFGKPFRGGARSADEKRFLANDTAGWLTRVVESGDHVRRAPKKSATGRPKIAMALEACASFPKGPPYPIIAPTDFLTELRKQAKHACHRSMDASWRRHLQPLDRTLASNPERDARLETLIEILLVAGPANPITQRILTSSSGRPRNFAILIGDAYRAGCYERAQLQPLEHLPLERTDRENARVVTLKDLLDRIDGVIGPAAGLNRSNPLRSTAFLQVKQSDVFAAIRQLLPTFPAADPTARKEIQRLQKSLSEVVQPHFDDLHAAFSASTGGWGALL